jgi:hypothetical protein
VTSHEFFGDAPTSRPTTPDPAGGQTS